MSIYSTLLLTFLFPMHGFSAPEPNGTTSDEHSAVVRGWVHQPNTRGTMDIIWDCLFTMFLCSWAILCMNVPPQDESEMYRWRRKFYLTCLTLLAPEWMFQIALGQWLHARRSVRKFAAAEIKGWTLKHGFFANMGGFLLQAKDSTCHPKGHRSRNWKPFPVNSDQLLYLIERGYIEPPIVTKKEIKERDKVDGAIRILTLCQICWFLINVSGRAATHISISCLELTTAAFIFCAIGITFCWIHKPADLVLPIIIHTDINIQDILAQAGDQASHPYLRTPLDFVDNHEWPLSLFFQHCVQILRNLRVPLGPRIVPVPHIENTFDLPLPSTIFLPILFCSLIYVALFFCAWNYKFPTNTELALWRIANVTMLIALPVFWAMIEWTWRWYPALKRFLGRQSSDPWEMTSAPRHRQWPGHGRVARKARVILGSCKNNMPSRNPKYDIPLKAILVIYLLGPVYCSARTYVFIADFLELRALPKSSYDNVQWTDLIPHF